MSFDFNTLVTNRTQQDVAYAKYLAEKLVAGTATEAEKAEWNSFALKGVYNHTDLNRVTVAMDILKAKMESYGYAVPNYKKIEIPYPSTGGKVRLPDGYLELSYIESTGTQWIDTGFMHNQDTRVVMDVQPTSVSANAWAFGGRITNSSAKHDVFYYYTSNSSWTSDYNSSRKYHKDVGATDRVLIDFDKNVCSVNGVTDTHTSTTFQSTTNLILLALSTAGTISGQMHAKLYSCQIYDNGTLIRDYIPCINPFGDIGLFDVVSQQFYSNAGTGAFIAGAIPRTLPDGYTQVEYIESTGTQYIDTGVIPNQNIQMVVDAQFTNVSGTVSFAGSRNSESSDGDGAYFGWISVSGNLRSYYYNSFAVVATADTARHIYTKDKNQTLIDGSLLNTATAQQFRNSTYSIYLFANNEGRANFHASVRIYSCQIYDNGALVRDFVPCVNNTGITGLYDVITANFYQNAGTGTFTMGNPIASATQSSGDDNLNSGKVTLRNLVADGSFETTNTWSTWSTDALVTEQAYLGATSLKLTGDQLAQVPVELPILNHVYYAREYIRTDGDVTSVDGRFEVHGGDGVGLNWVYGWNRGNYPGWTIQSGVHKIEAVNASSYVLRTFKVGGSGTAYVDGVMLIDLTAAFGSGFEPDKEWCDTHIPFFDGSKVLTLPPRYDWQEYDIPTVSQLSVYLTNVAIIRSVLAVRETTPDVPVSMLNFMLQEANDIEQILLDVSRQLSIMATTFIPCGEALCGGDNL